MIEAPPSPEELRVRLPEYAEPFLEHAPYKSMAGGRGSAKSHSFAQMSILRMAGLLPDYPDRPVRIASARDFQVNIKQSVKEAIEGYIYKLGMRDEFEIQAFEINHLNGSHMWFPGFDVNPRSFMSVEAVDVLWIEQAELIQAGHMELIVPSMFRDAENMAEMWFSWNPFRRDTWCWQRFVENKRSDDLHVHVNFSDNPFFPPGQERERMEFELDDPERYKHVWLGEPDDGDADKVVLAYSVLKKCVEAYEKGLAPSADDTPLTDSGLDVAEGGRDKCAQVIRQGPVIDFTDEWPGVAGDLSVPVVRAHENTIEHGYHLYRMYYDGSSPLRREFLRINAPYGYEPVAFGGEVKGKKMLYEPGRPNGKVFNNRAMQMADALRLRANRTVRLLKGDDVNPHLCLFINPDIHNLERFLTQMGRPIRRLSPQTGKWELDKRGGKESEKSPDLFDAACLAFARDSKSGLSARR